MAVKASEVAAFLGRQLVGSDVLVDKAKPASSPEPGSLVFAKKYSPEMAARLNAAGELLVLAVPEYEGQLKVAHIITARPRLDLARVLQRFMAEQEGRGVSNRAEIAASARLGRNVSVGHFSVVGENVEIGDDTVIANHVVIRGNCVVGDRCLIKSNTVIGEKGFGFERDEDGVPVTIPHVGRVVIGSDVEIGALSSICRGTLGDTIISDHVKIDDQVFIAHNVLVGESTLIIACAEISGSVRIGEKCWIGPNTSIINGVEIGDETMIGIGAVVTKPIGSNVVAAGNPARVVRKGYKP